MRYLVTDEDYEMTIEAATSKEAAEEFVIDRDYCFENNKTTWVQVWVTPIDERVSHMVGVEPDEPSCVTGISHIWKHFFDRVDKPPGGRPYGGRGVVTEACIRCGVYRITDVWPKYNNDSQWGTLEYQEADEASLAWVDSHGVPQ